MKRLLKSLKICCILALLNMIGSISHAQDSFTVNHGGTSQQNYFTKVDYENVVGKIILKATIRGKEYRFVLDTGAPNAISQALLNELNPPLITKMPIWDISNKVDSLSVVSLSGISIGNVIFNDIPTVVPKEQFIFECLGVDGFIGSNMLRNSILQISSNTQKIVITDQVETLKLNNQHASDLFLTKPQSSPIFESTILNTTTANIPLLFDTGSPKLMDIALAHYAFCEKEPIFNLQAKSVGNNAFGIHGPGGDTTQYLLQIPGLNINGTVLNNITAQTVISDDSIVGTELLKYGVVTVDYMHKKFYFEPFKAKNDAATKSFPIAFIPQNNKVVIGIIWDEQLRSKVSINDQLLAINDVDYTNISACDFILKSKQYEGLSEAKLTLKSPEGKLKKVTISKR
ncbi:retropepsin-like aspartic protease [Pedobacter sp. GR22-6]|uniref:retropepsin-like aspartic protease n=1 Tax=Pedobacter sp. GR22-6 TaxID=3127957 RepID=UPI00307DAAA0